MATPIHAQLLVAFKNSQLTLEELLAKAGLDCDITSLSRKLHGKQILTTSEAEALALALKASVSCGPKARGGAA